MADLFTPTDEDMRAMFIGNKFPEARGRMWDEWLARHDAAVWAKVRRALGSDQ